MKFIFLKFRAPALALTWMLATTLVRASSVYFIGNSVTDVINYTGFEALAASRGHAQPWGRDIILGSPLYNIWNNPAAGFSQSPFGFYPAALGGYTWDYISLQPFDCSINTDVTSIKSFVDLALPQSPGLKVLVYARWPRQNGSDYDTNWLLPYTDFNSYTANESKAFFEQLTQTVKATYPGREVDMVPVGHVMYELNQRMKAGLVPGYTNIYQLYADGIHLNNVGSYLVALTYFATMYREDPNGLPVPSDFGSIPANVVAALQDCVWGVVTSTPLSGVVVNLPLEISTVILNPAIAGQGYSASLSAHYGTVPYTWSVASGTLPAGITLSSAGLLSGTAAATGTSSVTFRVSDSGTSSATRTLSLAVQNDTIPAVVTSSLPAGKLGSPYSASLTGTSGNGTLHWLVVSGTFPSGLALADDGTISGAPRATGTFNFTVQVTDSDATPDSATAPLSITIGNPDATTLQAKQIDAQVKIDGVLDEGFWNLAQTGTVTSVGASSNTVTFAVVWDTAYLYVAARVLDNNIWTGSSSPLDASALHVLIDTNNDREVVFNSDGRHFIVDADGRFLESNGRGTGVERAVTRIPGGYAVELAIPWSNLGIVPSANVSIGFDLGAGDDTTHGGAINSGLVWYGANLLNPAPSQFGSLLLSGSLAGGGVAPSAVVRDPVDYATGAIDTQNGGSGWAGGWSAQNASYYAVSTSFPLLIDGLATSPSYLIGGGLYTNVGRSFSTSGTGPLAPWLATGNNYIGKPGTDLWGAFVIRRDHAGESTVRFGRNSVPWANDDSSSAFKVTVPNTTWVLASSGSSVDTGVAATVGQPYLIAFHETFTGTNGTVQLYVNPQPGIQPVTPQATLTLSAANSQFRSLSWYPDQNTSAGSLDEIRLGPTFASVAPTVRAAPSIVTNPQGATLTASQSYTLRANCAGTAPLTVQWYKDGIPLAGGTTADYLIQSASSSVAGGYSAIVSNSLGSVVTGTAQVIYTGPEPYPSLAQWRQQNGLAADGSQDQMQSPAKDGIANLIKYALGLDLNTPGYQGHYSTGTVTVNNVKYPALTYIMPSPAPLGVTCYPEYSLDLVSWSSAGNLQSTVSSGWNTITYQYPNPISSTGRLFFRLRFTTP